MGEMRSRTTLAVCFLYLLAGFRPFSAQVSARTSTQPSGQASTPPRTLLGTPAHRVPIRNTPPAVALPKPSSAAVLPAGLPLRIQLDHRYRMRKGAPIVGRLIDPVYSGQHIVLPKGAIVTGVITDLQPIAKSTTLWARLDGDVTPLKQPILTFNSVQLPGASRLPLTASATERTAGIVKMTPAAGKQSLLGKVKQQFDAKKQSVQGMFHSPHKSDLALKFFYGQLPYHPQDIWAGTQFDAVLAKPLSVTDPQFQHQLPVTPPLGHIPPGTLNARLITSLSSATGKIGDPVVAMLTQPYLNPAKTGVILPTGTRILGVVTQAKPARKLGRNGTLRFTFRQIELPGGVLQQMHGQMTAVEGAKGQHVTVDSEGGAQANSGQGKFLAPLLLGALAGNSLDADQNAVHAGASSNGFGMVARIISLAVVTPAVTAGFAYYALGKSITRRWIMPGHNVVFEQNTRMQLAVADR